MIDLSSIIGLKDSLKSEFAAFFVARDFVLRDGATVNVKCVIGSGSNDGVLGRASVTGLTGGMDIQRQNITVFVEDWDAASPGREPKKGDVCRNGAERLAISAVYKQEAGGIGMLYKMDVAG